MSHRRKPSEDQKILRVEEEILREVQETHREVEEIERRLRPKPKTPTPNQINFKEITMNLPDPGQTLVFTGTTAPTGSVFPSGTAFTATSADPLVTVTVDATGLIVTATIDPTDVAGTVADITWATSTYTPVAPGTATSLTVTIPLTIGTPPPPPVGTPDGVTFAQTT